MMGSLVGSWAGCAPAVGRYLLAGLLLGGFTAPLSARPLAEVKLLGEISVCANPNALPFAADNEQTPGFQIEIARALAKRLGVRLKIDWIVPRMRANTVDCDFLMDTILRPGVQPPSIKTTVPYSASGVSLAFARGAPTVPNYKSLRDGMRVGVLMNSLASLIISKTGAAMVPFGFEDDLAQGVASGDVVAGALSPATIGYYNLKHPDQPLTLVHAEDDEAELRWSVAVGLRRADDAMLAAMNEAVSSLLADGTITGIYARYGIEHRRP